MQYLAWRERLRFLQKAVQETEANHREALEVRNRFLHETIGMAPGDIASLEATAEMVSKIFEMKKEG